MSDKNVVGNPFAALFPCITDAEKFRYDFPPIGQGNLPENIMNICSEDGSEPMQVTEGDTTSENNGHVLNHHLEEIFRFTLSKEPCCPDGNPPVAIYLPDVSESLNNQLHLDINCIEQALFERLLLENLHQHVVYKRKFGDEEGFEKACEKRKIFYLYQCLYRLMKCEHLTEEESSSLKKTIISQFTTAISHVDMFPNDNLYVDLIEILLQHQEETGHPDVLAYLFVEFSALVVQNGDFKLVDVLQPSLIYLKEKFIKTSIVDRKLFSLLEALHYFTKSTHLSMALVQFSMPHDIKNGKSFQNSLIGLPLSISCLPKSEVETFEFFQEPSRYSLQEHTVTEESLWLPLGSLVTFMHQLFYTILCQSTETRNLLLKWLGDCLHANSSRAKLWNSQLPELFSSLHVSDGFLITLEAVLLKLCKPFAQPFGPKILKVDPTYCVSESSSSGHPHHFKGISEETTLVPKEENLEVEPKDFNFTTECFFATHQALHIGFHVVYEKMLKINQDLVRIQRLYEEARQQSGDSSGIVERIKENMEKGMTKFLSYRTALLVPEVSDFMMNFHSATATWLIAHSTNQVSSSNLSFPLPETVSEKMSFIPEYILENIVDCTLFMKRFNPKYFEVSYDALDHFMTIILVLMGSPERIKNPHLRAHLAEMLEALMPAQEDEFQNALLPSTFREKLFTSHPLISELVPTLLKVFVSIEMTGQSVAFEQKFQYRRPMYLVLNYIRKFDMHKIKMKDLAEDAEKNIESPRPPLFLHFINLLINDAIYLLDEALSTMSKLRELQIARDSGAWDSMSPEQVQQQEGNFQHLGLLAKFHNYMSNETIQTLQWLTTEIKSIFCHQTIVERITAMLNYFLLHLVGPQKKNLKVKDLKEYEFKPQELVSDICRIYRNLGASSETIAENFCLAVSRDGRSYSPELFPQAQAVLVKIGQSFLANELEDIAKKVQRLALQQQREEEMLVEAPEEFLDPIMNTIMKDPVKLPSSGVTVDRQTIARHLLSDQTDPFNRSPLTMDMVIPDTIMKSRIDEWRMKRL